MAENHAVTGAEIDRVTAAVRQRLEAGESVDALLRNLRPASPRPEARPRDDGPPGALWRRVDTPLVGLSFLKWRSAAHGQFERLAHELGGRSARPAAIRIAGTNVFNDRLLVHAIFASGVEATHDLFAVVDTRAPEQPIVLNWTGPPLVRALAESRGDLGTYALEYLHLFCALTGTDDGRFAIVDRGDLAPKRAGSLPIDASSDAGRELRIRLAGCPPPELVAVAANGALSYQGHVLFRRALFTSDLELSHDGRVEMVHDEPKWSAD